MAIWLPFDMVPVNTFSASRTRGMRASDAALSSTRMAMSIGSVARDTCSTSRWAPSSRMTKSPGPSPSTGSPFWSTALTNIVRSRDACAPTGNRAVLAHAKAIPRARARARRSRNVVRMKAPDGARRSVEAVYQLDCVKLFTRWAILVGARHAESPRCGNREMAKKNRSFSFSRSAKSLQENATNAGSAAGASYTLVGAILVLGGIGYAVDRWQGTSRWGLIIGLTLGVVVGFYDLVKSTWRR